VNAPTAWTIGQLAHRVAEALAAGVPGQANGRVREVPDVRTLRWYTSIGLLDRPAAMRGRTALYGRRHLLQMVAVKRLQGEGWSLAEIQERLIGADDVVLEGIAALPVSDAHPDPESGAESAESGGSQGGDAASEDAAPAARRDRFWAAAPDAPDAPDASAPAASVTLSRSAAPAPEAPVARPRPAGRTPRAADTAAWAESADSADAAASAVEAELSALGIPPRAADLPQRPTIAQAIRLAADVTLVLDTDHTLDPGDFPALAEAARPLLDFLRHLGLSEPRSMSRSEP
jgi:hypothetical protein